MTAAEFAQMVKRPKRRADGKWWDAECPAHDDRRASLSFTDGDHALVVDCHAGCSREQIAAAVGRTAADFTYRENGHRAVTPRIVNTYAFRDERGAVLFEEVRLEPKDFRLRRPDGAGGWTWSLAGVRRVIYRLDELAEQRRVWLVEGPKDADVLWSLGIPATTTPGGAKGWRDEYATQIRYAGPEDVIACRDNDEAGLSYVRRAAAAIAYIGAIVRMLDLPDLPDKGDVSDFIVVQRAAGRTDDEIRAELVALAEQAPVFDAAAVAASISPPPPPSAQELRVPQDGIIGTAREFATLYSSYLESPAAFLYFVFLAYFGSLIARKVTLDSELRPEPRLYVVLIGESADTRKSTALRVTDQFFRNLGVEWEPAVLFGVGSAEGLAAELKERPSLILHHDEFKSFVDKAKNEHSVALPMVTTLFERGDYDNRTKTERVSVRDAALSLVAACTSDTYATMFDQRFFAIGLLNRLWLVSDRSTARIAIPRAIPDVELEPMRQRVKDLLAGIDRAYVVNGCRAVAYRVTSGAHDMFRAWYESREGSIFERRLDTYAHRLMILLAATTGKDVIDETIMTAVLALVRHQLDVRRECDPVDAENTIAATEEKIRRVLARGALSGRDLKRRIHSDRAGLWIWNTAIKNLLGAGDILRDPKPDLYWLPSAVTTPVTTEK